MTRLASVVGIAMAATVIGACALSAPVTCPDAELAPQAPLTCEDAVSAARPQLTAVAGITALRFEYDVCAPNAPRCEFLFGTAGNLIALLGDGAEVGVWVSIDPDGNVRADQPRPFSTESQPTPLP